MFMCELILILIHSLGTFDQRLIHFLKLSMNDKRELHHRFQSSIWVEIALGQ